MVFYFLEIVFSHICTKKTVEKLLGFPPQFRGKVSKNTFADVVANTVRANNRLQWLLQLTKSKGLKVLTNMHAPFLSILLPDIVLFHLFISFYPLGDQCMSKVMGFYSSVHRVLYF